MKRHTVKLFSLITGLALSLAAFFAVTVFLSALSNYYFFIGQVFFLLIYWSIYSPPRSARATIRMRKIT